MAKRSENPIVNIGIACLEIGACAVITAGLTGFVIKPATKMLLEESIKAKHQWDNWWASGTSEE